MKRFLAYAVSGCVVVGFVAAWISLSWTGAVTISALTSLIGLVIVLGLDPEPSPVRLSAALFAALTVFLAATLAKLPGLAWAAAGLVVAFTVVALLAHWAMRGHALCGFWGGLQRLGLLLLGLPATAQPRADARGAPGVQKLPLRPVRAGNSPYVFIGHGQSVTVGGFALEEPLIYVTNRRDQADFDASVVYLKGKISPPRQEPPGALGYWPRTSELTSAQVGRYLQWHAGGRQDPEIDLGYVFIFFYGLERRALVEEKDIEEVALEIVRLLSVYGQSGSFRGYATGLLTHLVMRDWLEATQSLLERLLIFQEKHISEELLATLLGHFAKEGAPVPANLAMMLAQQDERSRRSVVVQRTPEEFERLFYLRYSEKFAATLCPNLSGKFRTYHYRPASPSLVSGYGRGTLVPPAKWPSVAGWRRQFAPVVKLYNECIDELKGYVQKAKASGVESIAAYEALPPDLREATEHPLQSQWEKIVDAHSPEEGGLVLVPVRELAELRDITFRPKLTKTQSVSLARLVDSFGTSIEPDVRYTQKPYKWNDYVAILRLPDEPYAPQGQTYGLVSMLMPLAMEVSLASGAVEPEEAAVMVEFFEERFMLSRNDRIRTEALMNVLLNSEMSLAGLKSAVSACFSESQRGAVGKFLVIIAGAVEGVCDAERDALTKSFKALNIDPGLVQTYMAELGLSGPAESPVTVQPAAPREPGEQIPAKAAALDESRIRAIIDDTNEIVDILVQATDATRPIPTGEEDEQTEAVGADQEDEQIAHLGTLRGKLHPILLTLLKQDEWPPNRVEEIARENGVTLAAAMDEINEWAYEHFGDPVLEGDETIIVNRGLLGQ